MKVNGTIIEESDEALVVRTRLYARILYPFLVWLVIAAVVGGILPADWWPVWIGIAIGMIVFYFAIAFPAPYSLYIDKVHKKAMIPSFFPRRIKTYPLHDIQLEKSLRRGDTEYPMHWDIFFIMPDGRRVRAFGHSTEEVVLQVFKLIKKTVQPLSANRHEENIQNL